MSNTLSLEGELAAFRDRVSRAPKVPGQPRVIGGVVGSKRHQRNKRNRQRQKSGTWRYRH